MYITSYSSKNSLGTIWEIKEILRALSTTGVLIWSWPYVTELMEWVVDGISLQKNPIAFLFGLCGGLFLKDSSEVEMVRKVCTLRFPPQVKMSEFSWSHVFWPVLQLGIFGGGVLLIPKMAKHELMIDLKSLLSMLLATLIACQGFFSGVRCTRKCLSANRSTIEISREQKAMIIPYLPITEQTLDQILASLPHMSRGWAIYSHMYPLTKYNTHGLSITVALSTISALAFIHHRDKTVKTAG